MWAHLKWIVADHGMFYGPTSGWIPDLTMLTGMSGASAAWWHKHNCHEDRCWRLGHRLTVEASGEHVRRCRRHHKIRHQPEGETTA